MAKKLSDVVYGPSPVHRMARKLQMHRKGPVTYRIDREPYCDNPIPIVLNERGKSEKAPGAYVDMKAPCRKCDKCKQFKRLQWRDRMVVELVAAPRSWFVTLTFDPIHLAGVIAESRSCKGDSEQERVEVAAYRHVQNYLKRLRKNCGSFRYVAVAEYGSDNGRLHYHLLLHEKSEGQLPYRIIDTKWRSFVQANLVRKARGSAGYVSKYITKAISRPRASNAYGKSD